MRKDQRIEIGDPDRILAENGIAHELHFTTDFAPGQSSGTAIHLTDRDMDALIEAIADRKGRPAYWVLSYRGDGPDSSQGGYDNSDDAAQALREKRAEIRANPRTILDPTHLVATRCRVVRTEHDEEW